MKKKHVYSELCVKTTGQNVLSLHVIGYVYSRKFSRYLGYTKNKKREL